MTADRFAEVEEWAAKRQRDLEALMRGKPRPTPASTPEEVAELQERLRRPEHEP